jgi:hypothetical protein
VKSFHRAQQLDLPKNRRFAIAAAPLTGSPNEPSTETPEDHSNLRRNVRSGFFGFRKQ